MKLNGKKILLNELQYNLFSNFNLSNFRINLVIIKLILIFLNNNFRLYFYLYLFNN